MNFKQIHCQWLNYKYKVFITSSITKLIGGGGGRNRSQGKTPSFEVFVTKNNQLREA